VCSENSARTGRSVFEPNCDCLITKHRSEYNPNGPAYIPCPLCLDREEANELNSSCYWDQYLSPALLLIADPNCGSQLVVQHYGLDAWLYHRHFLKLPCLPCRFVYHDVCVFLDPDAAAK